MSIENIWPGDVALTELLEAGETAAPGEILAELQRRGHVALKGKPTLTASGRDRAKRLEACRDLRRMFTAGKDGHALHTDGGSTMHVNSGRAVEIKG